MKRLFSLNRERVVAVVDIGSGYVGCAFVGISDKHGRIISSARSKLTLEPRDDEHARARLAEEIAEAIKAATVRAPGVHVSDVYAILHAPWTKSRVVAASAISAAETVIRAAHLSKLAENALQASPEVDRSTLFEMSAVSVRLNGYPTNKPEGKHAREVELFAIASAADEAVRAAVESVLHAGFPAARVSCLSSARVYAGMLQRMQLGQDSVVVDFGVQATGITVLRDGIPLGEHYNPEGLQSVLTRVHGTHPPDEVLGLFRMLERDACADDACVALQSALTVAEPELVKAFGETFAALAEAKRLPETLVLVAHPDVAPWLEHFFERIDFTQFTLTARPFTTRILAAEDLSKWFDTSDALDPALALAAAHVVADLQST